MIRWRVDRRFWAYAVGLPIGIYVIANSVCVLAGEPVRWSLLSDRAAPYLGTLVLVMFIGGGQEELGWRGFLAGSIAEKVRVDINGVQQGMGIRGRSVDNPVLLIVHGGPGMPDYFLTRDHPTGIEDLFTVVWWDQRGAGCRTSRTSRPTR